MAKNNIVLFEPEIPQNSGNIMRTCAGTDTHLHFIKPLGFLLEKERIKHNLTTNDLSKILNINKKIIENTEKGTQKTRYAAIGIMLKFYKKKIQINLIDE